MGFGTVQKLCFMILGVRQVSLSLVLLCNNSVECDTMASQYGVYTILMLELL